MQLDLSSLENTSSDDEPSIRDPGPDFSDFPNSADVVPVGQLYFESAVVYETPVYSTQFLFRVGLVEDLELRIGGCGYEYLDQPGAYTSGLGPMNAGIKWHIEDGGDVWYRPALGFEYQVVIPGGAPAFNPGTALPSFSLNFDHTLTDEFSSSWNLGGGYSVDPLGEEFEQLQFQASVTWSPNDDWSYYIHGFETFPKLPGGDESCAMMGAGFLWYLSDRAVVNANYNFPLTSVSPHRNGTVGMSFAF